MGIEANSVPARSLRGTRLSKRSNHIGPGSIETSEYEIIARFILAAVFGGIIGIEREFKQRPAGLRTNMLTALAAAVFTVVTFELVRLFSSNAENFSGDPLRLIEAVTAGVAFLAAGTIIHTRGQVEGLTTGAGMWLAGALGVACGAGFYFLASVAVVLATVILAGLRWLEVHFRTDVDTGRKGLEKDHD